MTTRIDREIRKLRRTLDEWRRQRRTALNQSMLAVGEQAILARLNELSRQRKAVAA